MPLEDLVLPKTYKNGKVLFEKDLDVWRQKTEQLLADVQLNLTQLIKDAFSAGYVYDNDGNPNKPLSLEDRLNQFEGGNALITGTSSDTFTINSDGNAATLDTINLTSSHSYTFPDLDGQFLTDTGIQNSTGAKTFFSQKLKQKGAGVGTAIFDYANTPTNRIYTFPDAGADAFVLLSEGAQSINGINTFTATIMANGAVAIDLVTLGNRIDLDADNDTSIRCSADDIIQIELGGVDQITITTTNLATSLGLQVNNIVALDLVTNGNRIDLDADNDTSIRCSADDNIVFELNGVDRIVINSSGEYGGPDVDPPTANFSNKNSLVKAWFTWDDSAAVFRGDYNMVSITDDDDDGIFQANWDTDMIASQYAVSATAVDVDLGVANVVAFFADHILIHTFQADGVGYEDLSFTMLVAGDQ